MGAQLYSRFLKELFFPNMSSSRFQAIGCGIVESILNWVKFKAQVQLKKKCSAVKHNRIKGIPKLDDANDAGTHLMFLNFMSDSCYLSYSLTAYHEYFFFDS